MQTLSICQDGRNSRVDIARKIEVVQRITRELSARLEVLFNVGLGYLSLDRSAPTLSPGELQHLRLAMNR